MKYFITGVVKDFGRQYFYEADTINELKTILKLDWHDCRVRDCEADKILDKQELDNLLLRS